MNGCFCMKVRLFLFFNSDLLRQLVFYHKTALRQGNAGNSKIVLAGLIVWLVSRRRQLYLMLFNFHFTNTMKYLDLSLY